MNEKDGEGHMSRWEDSYNVPADNILSCLYAGKEKYSHHIGFACQSQELHDTILRLEEQYQDIPVESVACAQCDLNGRLTHVSPSFLKMWGYEQENVMGRSALDFWESEKKAAKVLDIVLKRGAWSGELRARKLDGTVMDVSITASLIKTCGGRPAGLMASFVDITVQKRLLRILCSYKDSLAHLLELNTAVIYMLEYPSRNPIWVSSNIRCILGYKNDEVLTEDWWEEHLHPQDRQQVLAKKDHLPKKGLLSQEYRLCRTDGSFIWVFDTERVVEKEGLIVGSWVDITDHKQKEIAIYERDKKLQALHNIDTAIMGSRDLKLPLKTILDEALNLTGADAGVILRSNRYMRCPECVASRGFETLSPDDVEYGAGNGPAALAMNEGRIIWSDFTNLEREIGLADERLMLEEGFSQCVTAPITNNGCTMGIIQLFSKKPAPENNPDCEDIIKRLAGRAGLAMDNFGMYRDLERAHQQLLESYDSTIAGWAMALGLKDEETQEHSRRVTHLALRMAKKMGMSDADLSHIRRGALLHDIGKMGIPDSILLKKGKLNEEEMNIVRKHPVYAFQMLSGIEYLRPALDIPYCHHERWDGTGYPRGLKGKQIPLSARIFGVVDTWDSLTSDRPYGRKWTRKETREYIIQQAGKHFDPEVVSVFCRLLEEKISA